MLTAAHGLRPGIEIGIPNRNGVPLIITSIDPPEGYFASRPSARWSKENPVQFAPARVVRDFSPDNLDLALVKVEGINVPYFELAAKPEAGDRSFQVPGNPLVGRKKLGTPVMKIEDRGKGARVAWVEHEFVRGDSGSALLDSSGRLVGLLNRIYTMSYGPLSQFDGIDKATLDRIIVEDRKAKASTSTARQRSHR